MADHTSLGLMINVRQVTCRLSSLQLHTVKLLQHTLGTVSSKYAIRLLNVMEVVKYNACHNTVCALF